MKKQWRRQTFTLILSLAALATIGLSAFFWWHRYRQESGRIERNSAPSMAIIIDSGLVAITLAALSITAAAIIRVHYRHLVKRPGPIRVLLAGDLPSEANSAAEATMRFAKCLVSTKLYEASALPGNASAPDPFLEALTQAAEHERFAAFARLLHSALPRYAHTAHVTVRQHTKGHYTVAAGLEIRHGLRATDLYPLREFRCEDWRHGLDNAARAVAALILPHAKAGRISAPLADWKRKELPPELLIAYLDGKSLMGQRRYDEALGEFFEVLQLDCKSLHVRLDVAAVYQKLGLWLDALAVYNDVIHLSRLALSSKKWLRAFPWRKSLRVHSYQQAQATAEYRRAVLLSWGHELHDQWNKEKDSCAAISARDHERERIKRRLKGEVLELAGQKHSGELDVEVFQRAANNEANMLLSAWSGVANSQSWKKAALRHLRVGKLSLEILKSVTDYRLKWAETVARCGACGERPRNIEFATIYDEGGKGIVQRVGGRRATWLDYYNAACFYGVQLNLLGREAPSSRDSRNDTWNRRRGEAAKKARECLERAAVLIEPSELAAYRPWFRYEDPDLRELRRTLEFRSFADRYLPERLPRFPSPAEVQRFENVEQTIEMVNRATGLFAKFWRDIEYADVSARAAVSRWRQEQEFWWAFEELCRNHRHWQTRLRIMRRLDYWANENNLQLEPFHRVPFGDAIAKASEEDAHELLEEDGAGQVEEWAKRRVAHADCLFSQFVNVAKNARNHNDDVLNTLQRIARTGESIGSEQWSALCRHREALWQEISEQFISRFPSRPGDESYQLDAINTAVSESLKPIYEECDQLGIIVKQLRSNRPNRR